VGKVASIEIRLDNLNTELDKAVHHRANLKVQLEDHMAEKETELLRQNQAREMLGYAQASCRTVMIRVATERSGVQISLDIALIQHGIAQLLNHRLGKAHTHVFTQVRKYRDLLEPMPAATEQVKVEGAASRAKLAAIYTEIQERQRDRLAKTSRDDESDNSANVDKVRRVQTYIKVRRRLNEQATYMDHLLRRAAEVKFEH
jgi:hypothetical protein